MSRSEPEPQIEFPPVFFRSEYYRAQMSLRENGTCSTARAGAARVARRGAKSDADRSGGDSSLLPSSLENSLLTAIDLILEHPGKVVVTGVGKSGHVARKIVATLQSTGTPLCICIPQKRLHGDLGVCQAGDPVVMISKSGATSELTASDPGLAGASGAVHWHSWQHQIAAGGRNGSGARRFSTARGRSGELHTHGQLDGRAGSGRRARSGADAGARIHGGTFSALSSGGTIGPQLALACLRTSCIAETKWPGCG